MTESASPGPRPLKAGDQLTGFDCGEPELNSWLVEHAYQASRSGSAQTFVIKDGRQVVGYYALAAGSVEPAMATERAKRGMPRHPIPVILLARLAVTEERQGQGLGIILLRDALLRVASISDEVGIRAILVHTKSKSAHNFYRQYDFEEVAGCDHHLMLLLKDIRRYLSA